jgi:hypothetical protein
MKCAKITTSDGETRWLNLSHIIRVTLATGVDGNPLLVIVFQGAQPEALLKIHGNDETNQQAINYLIEVLDRHELAY